jgi:hypothetical protein
MTQVTDVAPIIEQLSMNSELPHREMCGLCHRVSAVGFHVPNEVWKAVVHNSRIEDIHCLNCFIERADEKLIAWDSDISFYPVSLRSHLTTDFEPKLRHGN